MRKMKVDEQHLEFFTALVTWLSSNDPLKIKEAQAKLNMRFRELTLVARQLLDPKDLPSG